MGTCLEEYRSSSNLSLDTEKQALAEGLRSRTDVGKTYGNLGFMIQTGLEFAPGTAEDCKKIVAELFPPATLLSAYRTAREACNTSDIVLVASDQEPDISGGSRMEYCKHLKRVFGSRASAFKLWHKSAHSEMKLPAESEAMWLVLDIRRAAIPTMVVIYATPYEATAIH